jgi:farnesyl-diphosphate farnesyltransferase
VHTRDPTQETPSEKICFEYLEKTSRSFSAVILELHPELLLPVALFYLILRGLDTIEDDTSIPAKTKEPLLRRFKDNLEVDGWSFDGNRPEEKDRDLLVNFRNVIEEFKKVKEPYRVIIKSICNKMGNGMADYCLNAEFNEVGVATIKDYDLYCHYVAGLVGEGLTRLFVESKFGNPRLLDRPELHESMGLFLQKINIIRDVKEDSDDSRRFWPKEIWSKHVQKWEDLFKAENREAALNCSSEMVLNALHHADDCLFYLAGLKEQSVFNFAAIPQSMAIATLALCFRNPAMFERNIKISKGQTCQLMIESTQNLQVVCEVFRRYVRVIRKKNKPKDPSFLKISIACGKIEQFIESIFPTQTAEMAKAKQKAMMTATEQAASERKAAENEEARNFVIYLVLAVGGTLLFLTLIMVRTQYCTGKLRATNSFTNSSLLHTSLVLDSTSLGYRYGRATSDSVLRLRRSQKSMTMVSCELSKAVAVKQKRTAVHVVHFHRTYPVRAVDLLGAEASIKTSYRPLAFEHCLA